MSKKQWSILYSNLLYKIGHYFLGTQYYINVGNSCRKNNLIQFYCMEGGRGGNKSSSNHSAAPANADKEQRDMLLLFIIPNHMEGGGQIEPREEKIVKIANEIVFAS